MAILLSESFLWNEVHPELNDLALVEKLTLGSKKTVWWLGKDCAHTWPGCPNNRSSGGGCPFCTGKRVLPGFNDLATLRPDLLIEWDDSNELDPTQIAPTNKAEVGWVCLVGHKYSQRVDTRKASNGCPVCSNRELLTGFNDLMTVKFEIAKLWSQRNVLPADAVLFNSSEKFWWTCEFDHEYPMPVNWKTVQGMGCSVCSGRHLVSGINDLATLYPEILVWWDSSNEVSPSKVHPGTNFLYWWLCPKAGHKFKFSPKNMRYYRTCPVCSNKRVQHGVNDLSTTHPHMASWLASKEDRELASTITAGSNKMLTWLCQKCSKQFQDQVGTQVNRVTSLCKSCRRSYSYFETAIENYLLSLEIRYLHRKSPLRNGSRRLELDFTLPDHGLAIEVQDFATHSRDSDNDPTTTHWRSRGVSVKRGPAYHELKRRLAKEQLSLTLIDIWEDEIRDGSFKSTLNEILSQLDSQI